MFKKTFFLFLLIASLFCSNAYCQKGDFCDAVATILRDAPNRFRNIKGRLLESNMNAIVWDCGVKVPGTIGSRFVVSMGSFYEGAFFQTKNKEDIKAYYDKYKALLSSCLAPEGFDLSLADNFYPGLADYKKVVLMPKTPTDSTAKVPPPHVTLEAAYDKHANNYTIVMYIFEH